MDITYFVDSAVTFITAYAMKTLGVILLLIGGWIVSRWAGRTLKEQLSKTRLDLTLVKFFGNITRWLVLLMTVLTALEVFGVKTTSFVAVLGAAGLAIGLAFQGTLSNFASGVMLLTFRPFKVGDAVVTAGQTGKIDEIDLFFTKMDTFDNRRIIIPNSKVFGSVIETITFHPTRRVDVPVGVTYDADVDETRAVLERAVEKIEGKLEEPAAAIFLDSFADSSVNWVVRVWANTSDFGAVKQATIRAIKAELDEAGIAIPYPQMDVHLDSEEAHA